MRSICKFLSQVRDNENYGKQGFCFVNQRLAKYSYFLNLFKVYYLLSSKQLQLYLFI